MRMLTHGVLLAGLSGIIGCNSTGSRPPPSAPVPPPMTEQERAAEIGNRPNDGVITRYGEPPAVDAPAPEPQPVPPPRRYEEPPVINPPPRPVPAPQPQPLPPPKPIVQEELPEEPAFVKSYRLVRGPKLAVVVQRSQHPADPFRDLNAPPPPAGAGPIGDTTIDYRLLELSLTDWLASKGRVSIRSSTQLPKPPPPDAVAAIRNGDRKAAEQVQQNLGVDIIVIVWAEISRQPEPGLGIRLVSEAVVLAAPPGQENRVGDSIARAFVDMPPRFQTDTVAVCTRELARKLMLDMSRTWEAWLAR